MLRLAMSRLSKILLLVLVLVATVLAVEAYLYLQAKKEQAQPSLSASPSPESASMPTVEIKGLALAGNLNLAEVSKIQVVEWAGQPGVLTVPAYSGSLPTPPPEMATLSAQASPLARPTTTQVVAGYFKEVKDNQIILKQGEEEIKLNLAPNARLWLKEASSLQMATLSLNELLSSPGLPNFLKARELVLAFGAKEDGEQIKTSGLLVFK